MTAIIVTTKDGSGKKRTLSIVGSIKPSGMITARVTTDKQDSYLVRIHPDGREECECDGNSEWHKRCYHIINVADNAHRFEKMDAPAQKKVAEKSVIVLPDGKRVNRVVRNGQCHNRQMFAVVTIGKRVVDVRLARSGEWEVVTAQEVMAACAADVATEQEKARAVAEAERVVAEKKAALAAEQKRNEAPLNGNRAFSFWR